MNNKELIPRFQISTAVCNDCAELLSKDREQDVAAALKIGNMKFACIVYLELQSEALEKRRFLESQRPVLRKLAMSQKRPCELLRLINPLLKATEKVIRETGKTIAAIRRAYSERCFV